MAIEVIAGSNIVSNAIRRPESHSPQRGSNADRLSPIAKPALRPGFRLVPGEPIFTIGSCFARNIETELAARGYRVPVKDVVASDPSLALVGQSILNNYAVPAIFNELSWALDGKDAFDEGLGFYEIYPGQFVDVNLIPKPTTLEECRARRRLILDTYRRIVDCRVIVMTLGLAEVWFDRTAQRYINLAPHKAMMRREPDRFEVHVLDYAETMGHLDAIFRLIRTHCRPDVRVLLSVSPVPFQLTFRNVDVMEANTYSKAVLRTAAENVRSLFDFVDYYPSFESVTLSDRGRAWQSDNIHVTSELVSVNCERMIEAYSSTVEDAGDDLLRKLDGLSPQEVFGLLEFKQEAVRGDRRVILAFATAALQINRVREAEAALSSLAAEYPAPPHIRAELHLAKDEPEQALALLTEEPEKRAAAARFQTLRLKAELALGNFDAARETATRLHQINNRRPDPFRLLGVYASKRGNVEQADNYFRQALALANDSPVVMLDYVEHLHRSNREDEAMQFLEHIDPANLSHQSRLDRLRSGLLVE